MQHRTYRSDSLPDAHRILAQEWSRHTVAVRGGEALNLHFSIRPLGDAMTLSRLSYGAAVRIEPGDREDVLLLQMPMAGSGAARYRWGNAAFNVAAFGLIDVRHVEQVDCGGDFDALVLRIRRARVLQRLEQALGRRAPPDVGFEPSIRLGTPAWEAWEPVAAALGAWARAAEDAVPVAVAHALEELVLATLVHAHPHSCRDALAHSQPPLAPRHVRAAEDYARTRLPAQPSAAELAAHAGVSVRALFDGFRQFRGTTPVAFARRLRLEGARAELDRAAAPVAQVARRWGFGHAGHFAAQYRRAFGERPADTLRGRMGVS